MFEDILAKVVVCYLFDILSYGFSFVGIISNISSDWEDFLEFLHFFVTCICLRYSFKKKRGQNQSPKYHSIVLFTTTKTTTFFTKRFIFFIIPSHFSSLMLNEQNLSVFVVCFEGGKASLSWQARGLTFMCEIFFVHAPWCFNNTFFTSPKSI